MVFSSSAQTVGISNVPSSFSVYSSITTDEHIATLINDTITSTSKTWSSQKSVNTFPQVNDASASATTVYSSSKVNNTFPVINDASSSATAVYSSNKVNALIAGIVAQPGFSASVFPYLVDTITGLNVPSGYLRYDSATQINSPYLRFSWYDVQAVDVKRFLLTTIAPSRIVIFDAGNTNNYQIFEVNGFVSTGSGGGAWITFPVVFSSSGGTGTAGFSLNTQIVVGIQSQGIDGAQGSPGLSSSLFEYTLDRNSIVIGGGVGNGDIRFNNADLTLATTVWIDHLDTFGNDVERFVALLADGSQVVVQDKNQSANYVIYDVNSSSLVAGSYVALTVVYSSGANLGTLVNSHPVFLALQFNVSQTFAVGTVSTLSPGSSATVNNSGTQNDIVLNFGIPQGTTGTAGTNATNPAFTASVVSASSTATPAVALTGTYPNLNLGFTLKNGVDGAGSATYARWTRNIGSTTSGWYADTHIVVGWDNTSNEITIRLVSARTGVYAFNLVNNSGSFPNGASMLLTTSNRDYYFQSSIGQIDFIIASDNIDTVPLYKVRVLMTGSGGTACIYGLVEKFHQP